ncbi:MAG: DoxX family protein [Gemmatimonadaceae bacterium]
MDSLPAPTTPSKRRIWAGRIISGLATAFMIFDAVVHISRSPAVVEGFTKAGFSLSLLVPLSIIELICIALYVTPRTAVLGVILLTGYLGGAVATNVRMGMPMFTYILAPVYIAVLLWLGLWLRDDRVRSLIPLRSKIGVN